MATKPEDFPNSNPGDTDYPDGSALDEQTPGLFDGFPLKADWLNDFFAFFQKMASFAGVTLSGTVDTVLSSQFFESLLKIIDGSRIVIRTQAEYDAYFDGSGTKTGDVYLVDGVNYQLNNDITFGSNFKYNGDPGVITERAGLYKFISAGTVGTPIDGVHFNDKLIFDGKKATYTITTDGGFANISYCNNSRFEINVIDCKTSTNGGAYAATINTTANNIIKNISGCEAVNGSGVYGVYKSTISEVASCIGTVIYNCYNSNITKIHDNSGAGVENCLGSTIDNIYGNTTGVTDSPKSNITNISFNGVGVADCDDSNISNVNNNSFDGVNNCNDSNISNVYENGVTSSGIGVSDCDRSTIDNIHDNPEGGCIACDESTMSNIHNNASTSASIAGGCHNCSNAVFMGTFRGNTSPGTYDHISDCLTSMAFVIGDGTTSVKISAARETVNF